MSWKAIKPLGSYLDRDKATPCYGGSGGGGGGGGGGSTPGEFFVVDNVAKLRLETAPTAGYVYRTNCYATPLTVPDDTGAFYVWDSVNTDPDDAALTIKAVPATGRFKYIDTTSDRIFPVRHSGIDLTGATEQGVELSALASTLCDAGYYGMDATGCTFKTATSTFTIPSRAKGRPFKVRLGHFDGTAATFCGSITCTAKGESGTTGAGSVELLANAYRPYSGRYWTQAVVTGTTVFTGVSVITNLSVGDTVFVRLGADPTDASGWCYTSYYAKITAITPTSGTAGNVSVYPPAPRTPINPLPAYNLNPDRTATKHDMIKVTSFQDRTEFDGTTFTRVNVAPQFARQFTVRDGYVPLGSAAFSLFCCENTLLDNLLVDEIAGVNLGGGPLANYGWCIVTNQSRSTTIHNLTVSNFHATTGVLDEELGSYGTHFTGTTRIGMNIAGAFGGVVLGLVQTPYCTNEIVCDHLVVEGGANIQNSTNLRVGTLEIPGTNESNSTLPQSVFTSLNNVSGSLVFNGKHYDVRQQISVPLFNVTSSASLDVLIPVNGLIRSFKLYSSTLTGVTRVAMVRGSDMQEVADITADLHAGAWGFSNNASLLSFQGTNYWGETHYIRVVTDGTFPTSTGYFEAQIDMLLASPDPATGTFTASDPRLTLLSNGAPSANASYIGQRCFRKDNSTWYTAKAIGTGASDWVLG